MESGQRFLEPECRSDNEGLGDNVVLEQLVSIAGIIIHANNPVAEPEPSSLADVNTDNRKQLPSKIRTGAESPDVGQHREMHPAAERLFELQTDDRIDPLLGVLV